MAVAKLQPAKKPEKKVTRPRDPVKRIFAGNDRLYNKLKEQAKLNFRTPEQQLIYYTWKCIEFTE